MDLTITSAAKDDYELMCDMIDALDDFESTLTPILSNSTARRLEVRKHVRKNFRDKNSKYFIAKVNSQPIGMVLAKFNSDVRQKFTQRKVGTIEKLFVRETHRKKGIATKLINTAKGWLREKGAKWFEASVCVNNFASIKTLEKSGFKPYSYIMHCYEF